jgi:hypothetical protein
MPGILQTENIVYDPLPHYCSVSHCSLPLNFLSLSLSTPPLWSSGQSSWLHNGDVLCFLWGTNWIYICYVEESRYLQPSQPYLTDFQSFVSCNIEFRPRNFGSQMWRVQYHPTWNMATDHEKATASNEARRRAAQWIRNQRELRVYKQQHRPDRMNLIGVRGTQICAHGHAVR